MTTEVMIATTDNAIQLQPARTAALTPMDMIDRAIVTGASVDILERLMAVQERWQANQAKVAFNNAMAMAKSRIPKIIKNKKVGFTSAKGRTDYSYEDLSAIADVVDPILSEYGLSYRFRTETEGNSIKVTCIISHRDGHSEENSLSAGSDQSGNKNSIQAVGSTQTYLSRYTLKAALGLAATNDDDGKNADKAPDGVITDAEREIIMSLLDETGSDIEKFCDVLEINSISEMPVIKFRRAIGMLEAKKRKVAANG